MTAPPPIGRTLFEAISLAAACRDRDPTSFVLRCVLVEPVSEYLLRCVATNGHALAVVHADGGPLLNPPGPRLIHPDSIRRATEFHRRIPRRHGRIPHSGDLKATWGARSVLITDERSDDACGLKLGDGTFPNYRNAYESLKTEDLKQGFMPNTGIDWRYLQLVERLLGQSAARCPKHLKRGNIFRSDPDYVLVMPISLPELREVAA